MKKMKKIISVIACSLLALIPVLSASMKTQAYSAPVVAETVAINWLDSNSGEYFTTTNAYVKAQGNEFRGLGIYQFDEGEDIYLGMVYGGFVPGDTVTFDCPFVVEENDDTDGRYPEEYWEFEGVSGNSVTFVCIKEARYCMFVVRGHLKRLSSGQDDQFWFNPMKTQLAIAAEVAAANGSGVAEVSGDFSLSYEIMKWLEDHPGVTLKYTLTYNGEEHLIVIQGGQKLANPEIPWYGPEYLIGNFGK